MHKLIILSLIGLFFAAPPKKTVTIYMAGDSTMADKPLTDNPERGWGQLFPEFFKANVAIKNHARNGRSTRTFISEGRWQAVVDSLKPGDYVFIQFGHNDQSKEKVDRYTPPGDYKANLIRFVTEVRAKKGKPVLCTPIMRRRFDAQGKFYDVHGEYPGLTREVASMMKVPLLDMHRKSEKLLIDYGAEASKELFLWIPPGQYASLPEGKRDDTHFSVLGARKMAALAAEAICEQRLPLAKYLKDSCGK